MSNTKIKVGKSLLSYFENIEKYQSLVNAFTYVNKTDIPLHQSYKWIVAVKDNICTKNIPTTCSSKMLSNFVPDYNATVIQRLLDTNEAFLIGKTNMDEFGMGNLTSYSHFGCSYHPDIIKNLQSLKSPGGSSGGSAVAVALDMCDVAFGSDTGGSVRLPAAYTGIVGFKPTYGRISRYGLISYASSLDSVGLLSKKVSNIREIFDIIASEPDPQNDMTCNLPHEIPRSLEKLSIGIPQEVINEFQAFDSEILKSFKAFVNYLSSQPDITVKTIDLPAINKAVPAYYVLSSAEASSCLSRYSGMNFGYAAEVDHSLPDYFSILNDKSRDEGFGVEVKRRINLGTWLSSKSFWADYYQKATNIRSDIKESFNSAFEKEVDLILTPTCLNFAPNLSTDLSIPNEHDIKTIIERWWLLMDDENVGDSYPFMKSWKNDKMTIPSSLAGLPSISIPLRTNKESMGLQLIGRHNTDSQFLKISQIFEDLIDEFEKKQLVNGDLHIV